MSDVGISFLLQSVVMTRGLPRGCATRNDISLTTDH